MSPAASDPREVLEAWRAQGADRFDRAGFARIDALARRAAGHDGDVRRVLDARLGELIGAYAQALQRRPAGRDPAGAGQARAAGPAIDASAAAATAKPAANKRGRRKARTGEDAAAPPTLAALAARLDAAAAARGAAQGRAHAYPQLPALDEFRMRFARLRMDRQLRRSLEQAPGDAGPLNSARLVHRALNTMQALAPEYLQQFMAYLDALAWMERLGGGAGEAEEPAAAAGGKRARKRRE